MKIQITDRKLWLDKVNTAIQSITDERQRLLAEYHEFPWYQRIFSDDDWYAEMYAWYDLGVLMRVKIALESEGTGDVYLDAEELMVIQ